MLQEHVHQRVVVPVVCVVLEVRVLSMETLLADTLRLRQQMRDFLAQVVHANLLVMEWDVYRNVVDMIAILLAQMRSVHRTA